MQRKINRAEKESTRKVVGDEVSENNSSSHVKSRASEERDGSVSGEKDVSADSPSVSKDPVDVDKMFENLESRLIEQTAEEIRSLEQEESSCLPVRGRSSKRMPKLMTDISRKMHRGIEESSPKMRRFVSFETDPLSSSLSSKCNDRTSTSDSKSTNPSSILKNKKGDPKESDRKESSIDISMDPKHYLYAETSSIMRMSADLLVDEDEAVTDRTTLLAEAFKDDDVIADFEEQKTAQEEAERPKDLDLTLEGWGSWAGPGIVRRKKDRFVVKAKAKKRKDDNKRGLIISEAIDNSIEKLQPRSVPFPYTTVEDYEAVVRQPIGKDWNPQMVHQNLIQPSVTTQAGKVIRPISRCVIPKQKLHNL
ncbi:hypothetical protein AB6A40_010976 [Gnathostoma spinigerum]|uniref:Uncharacterized protein n=1 Tax=Gnathostoma spinigerum TaxID=75299 RepID=A0ABD6EYU9_9BILA